MNPKINESTGGLPNKQQQAHKLGRAPSRPRVDAKNPDLRDLTLTTWEAIERVNDPPELFNQGGAIVHIPASHGAAMAYVGADRLRWWLTSVLDFFEHKSRMDVAAVPPNVLLTNLLATPNPPLPNLIGVVRHPIFSADGTLHAEPGYSARTQRYYAPDAALQLRPVSAQPTPQEIEEAKSMLLHELLGDFPFVDGPSIAHALAALLLPFVRPLVKGPTPLHFIWKPKAGNGATLLAEVLCLLSCEFSKLSLPQQEEERRRTLLAVLSPGPGAVLLDNASSLEGAALASCLTQVTFEDRLIGSSKLLAVPNVCLWLGTGNNPDFSDEIARRTVPIHLDARIEHPDLRSGFRHELPAWAREHKASLVWSALTLCQAWIAGGMVAGTKSLGKFESWSSVIGGILEVVGVAGFLQEIEAFRGKTDGGSALVRGFVDAWAEQFKARDVRVADLLPLASSLNLGNQNDRSRAIRLGKLLSERQGQHFGEWRIEKRGINSGNQLWGLLANPGGGAGGRGALPPTSINSQSNPTLGVSTTSTTSTSPEKPALLVGTEPSR